MKFNQETLYVWLGGSCDYGNKERAGGGAYMAELDGKIIDSYTVAEFNTTEFRMLLKSMIHAMEALTGGKIPQNTLQQNEIKKIQFLTNVQYLQNFDKPGVSANADLIDYCINQKKELSNISIEVRIVPYHKFKQLTDAHELAKNAMRTLRKQGA